MLSHSSADVTVDGGILASHCPRVALQPPPPPFLLFVLYHLRLLCLGHTRRVHSRVWRLPERLVLMYCCARVLLRAGTAARGYCCVLLSQFHWAL